MKISNSKKKIAVPMLILLIALPFIAYYLATYKIEYFVKKSLESDMKTFIGESLVTYSDYTDGVSSRCADAKLNRDCNSDLDFDFTNIDDREYIEALTMIREDIETRIDKRISLTIQEDDSHVNVLTSSTPQRIEVGRSNCSVRFRYNSRNPITKFGNNKVLSINCNRGIERFLGIF